MDDDRRIEPAVGDLVAVGRLERKQVGRGRKRNDAIDVARGQLLGESLIERPEVVVDPDSEREVRYDSVGFDRRLAGVGGDDIDHGRQLGSVTVFACTPPPLLAAVPGFDVE